LHERGVERRGLRFQRPEWGGERKEYEEGGEASPGHKVLWSGTRCPTE
jgi:hypothetical protein